jgi:sensor histidine kinase YesM
LKKHLIIVVLSAVISLVLSYYLVISNQGELQEYTLTIGVLSVFLGILVAYVLYFLAIKLDKLLPWQTQTNNRLFIGFILQTLVAFSVVFGFIYLYSNVILVKEEFFTQYQETLIKLSILLCILLMVYSVIYFAFYSYYSFSTLQIESVKQERKQIDLQLKALKSQLSPHFLFNSLNTISSLVHTNTKKSELFIRKLANMYQFTLSSYHSMLISLEDELDFVNSYQYLLETRFEDKLTIQVDIPQELFRTKIPPLTLQMLIENAVKHNIMDKKNPLQVLVYVEGNHICVKNNITEEPSNKTSFHIGLKNINRRYLLLASKGISISNGNVFLVKIPIVR